MSKAETITLDLHTSWWLSYYLRGVVLAAYLTGREPDMERVSWWIERGVRVTVRREGQRGACTDLVR